MLQSMMMNITYTPSLHLHNTLYSFLLMSASRYNTLYNRNSNIWISLRCNTTQYYNLYYIKTFHSCYMVCYHVIPTYTTPNHIDTLIKHNSIFISNIVRRLHHMITQLIYYVVIPHFCNVSYPFISITCRRMMSQLHLLFCYHLIYASNNIAHFLQSVRSFNTYADVFMLMSTCLLLLSTL